MPYRAIVTPAKRTRQPSQPTRPDWLNPLTQGLQFLLHGAYPTWNMVDGRRGVLTGTAEVRRTKWGTEFALPFSASGQYIDFSGFTTSTTSDLTFLMVLSGLGGGSLIALGETAGDGHLLQTYEIGAGPTRGIRPVKGNVAAANFTPETAYTADYPYAFAVSYRHATGAYEYLARNLNTGALLRGTATEGSALAGNTGILRIGGTTGFSTNISMSAAAMWTRPLLSAELDELVVRNPWQLFAPREYVMPQGTAVVVPFTGSLGQFDPELRLAAWF